jgi:two-component system KDP operon response regulator KdpE
MNTPAKVLVIEDEKQIRRFVRVALEEEGCRVTEAETMTQGLLEAGSRKPDLLILDLGLPDGNGIDLIRDLRGWSDVPVLILSARAQENDKIDALDAGADDYLTKPFSVGAAGPGSRTAKTTQPPWRERIPDHRVRHHHC